MEIDIHSYLVQHIAKVEQGHSLARFNPLKVGGVADYFTEAATSIELATAVKAALDCKIPYYVVAAGTHTLFSDGGFPGLVILNRSRSFAIFKEKSQVVIDSGLPLSECIIQAARYGLGGITEWFSDPGTVGGALYANSHMHDRSFFSALRFATVLIPPTRLDKEATIVRYLPDWFYRPGMDMTNLQKMKSEDPLGPQPIILTAVLQLTSLRSDELQLRLRESAPFTAEGEYLGPVFLEYYSNPDELEALLKQAGVSNLTEEGLYVDRYHPALLRKRKTASSMEVFRLIEQMQRRVQEVTGRQLHCRYELAGVW